MMPGMKVADVARKHGTTRWQIYDWRKQMRKGNLVVPESVAALPMFAELVIEDITTDASSLGGRSDLEIVVGDVVIRVGVGADEGQLTRAIRAARAAVLVMFAQGGPVKVFVATRPVDFRKGIDGLALAVQEMFGLDPFCGAVFVFRSKRADRIKLLVWDQTGMVLVHKRLEGGKFVWPQVRDGVMRLSFAQLSALFEGLDWRLVRPNAHAAHRWRDD